MHARAVASPMPAARVSRLGIRDQLGPSLFQPPDLDVLFQRVRRLEVVPKEDPAGPFQGSQDLGIRTGFRRDQAWVERTRLRLLGKLWLRRLSKSGTQRCGTSDPEKESLLHFLKESGRHRFPFVLSGNGMVSDPLVARDARLPQVSPAIPVQYKGCCCYGIQPLGA
jgi:hypothetical protein